MGVQGKVYLVGAGPGDPELLTLRGHQCLKEADCVVYDNLIDASILDWCKPSCRRVYVGKRGQRHAKEQNQINSLLIDQARKGKIVVRLKGGDPFIFGRGGEEAEALAAYKVPFEVVPGVSSAIGVPAYAGIPLTHRLHSSMVSFVTGHQDPAKDPNTVLWRRLSPQGTLVILMGIENLKNIVQELIHRAWPPSTPCAIIQWGSFPMQKTVTGTLKDIEEKAHQNRLGAPSIIVVGQVVSLREKLKWFEKKPLFGKTIVVTRARDQIAEFSRALKAQGARVIEIPVIRIVPTPSTRLDQALKDLAHYDWLIFTSTNGVEQFYKRAREKGLVPTSWNGLRTCAIGPKTADRMKAYGISVTKMAKEYRAEAIIPELGHLKGKRILLPRAKAARDVLIKDLSRLGAKVDLIPVYKTMAEPSAPVKIKKLLKEKVDCVTFTSSSTATHFLKHLTASQRKHLFSRAKAASIGPITTATIKRFGITPAIKAQSYTTADLARAIQENIGGA